MLLTEVTAASKIAERTPDRLAGAETCTEFKYISTHAGTWQAGRQAGIWRSRGWHERRPTSPTTHPHSGRLPSSAKAPRRLEMRGARTEDPQRRRYHTMGVATGCIGAIDTTSISADSNRYDI